MKSLRCVFNAWASAFCIKNSSSEEFDQEVQKIQAMKEVAEDRARKDIEKSRQDAFSESVNHKSVKRFKNK